MLGKKSGMRGSQADEFQIQLCKNSKDSFPRTFTVSSDWDFPKFKKRASQFLDYKVKRVFLASGEEILGGVDEMGANSTIYVSRGEAFFSDEEKGAAADTEVIKLAVLGTGGVGKSALTLRFARDIFLPEWESTIEDAYRVRVEHEGRDFIFDILDTAGQDDFLALRPSWMADKHAYIFVFSLAEPESFNELKAFFELHTAMNAKNRVQICIVGSKQDLLKENSETSAVREAARAQALAFGGRYFETSSSSGENVRQVFMHFLETRSKLAKVHNEMQERDKCVVM